MKGVVKRLYNLFLRERLPRKVAVYNGVPVRNVRLLDQTDEFPAYEGPLLRGIRDQVAPGDDVVIVGGGLGVSSVVAAHQCGTSGSVVAFEGGRERANRARETLELNRVGGIVTIRHGIVGSDVDVQGTTGGAKTIPVTDLPDCDVLVLDCEGAELDILEKPVDARAIVVETHGFLDAPESQVRELIEARGYEVVDRGVEAEELGVYVLTAVVGDATA